MADLKALDEAVEAVKSRRKNVGVLVAAVRRTMRHGCGDNSCEFRKPSGMATNGGCRCWDNVLGHAFHALLPSAPGPTPTCANCREAFIAGYERGREDEVWRAESRADDYIDALEPSPSQETETP